MYFVLDTEIEGQKYLVLPAEQADALLRIDDAESLRNIQSEYLINVSITVINLYECWFSVQIATKDIIFLFKTNMTNLSLTLHVFYKENFKSQAHAVLDFTQVMITSTNTI